MPEAATSIASTLHSFVSFTTLLFALHLCSSDPCDYIATVYPPHECFLDCRHSSAASLSRCTCMHAWLTRTTQDNLRFTCFSWLLCFISLEISGSQGSPSLDGNHARSQYPKSRLHSFRRWLSLKLRACEVLHARVATAAAVKNRRRGDCLHHQDIRFPLTSCLVPQELCGTERE